MAKAQFHRGQRVWVGSVGAWASVEKLTPVWAKGFDEPVRITYDVGLGRDFQAHELRAEAAGELAGGGAEWRLLRARNKWQNPSDCIHHPHPGTFPVVVTDVADWGGWRTPGAEYDRDPARIERQARLIAAAPRLMELARALQMLVDEAPDDAPEEIASLARTAATVLRDITSEPAGPADGASDGPPDRATPQVRAA